MLSTAEVAGFLGAGLAGATYVPQISHLMREHCSAGISRVAYGIWLVASLLILTQALAIRASVFIFLGVVQIAAMTLILFYAVTVQVPVAMGSGRGLGSRADL